MNFQRDLAVTKIELREEDARDEYLDVGKREKAMDWISSVIAAIATLAGVVMGVWLNHYFRIRAIKPTAQIQEITDAYIDYLDGVTAVNLAQMKGQEAEAGLKKVSSAQLRIAVYGHPDVVAAMAYFDKQGLSQLTCDTHDEFLSIIYEMRKHVSKDGSRLRPKEDDIKILIFGARDRDG